MSESLQILCNILNFKTSQKHVSDVGLPIVQSFKISEIASA